jgi:hypothetical protein
MTPNVCRPIECSMTLAIFAAPERARQIMMHRKEKNVASTPGSFYLQRANMTFMRVP